MYRSGNGGFVENPRVDNGRSTAGGYKNKRNKAENRLLNLLKNADFISEYYGISENVVIQFSSCHLAEGVQYGKEDEKFEDRFQINILPQDGIRHFKSEQGALQKLMTCERRAYRTESYFWGKNENGEWAPTLLLDDDAYLLGSEVKSAFAKWAELAGFQITGDLKIKQVSIKVDEKPPFTTLAWVQKSSKGILTCLLDNGKLLCLEPENIGCEDIEVAIMGYYRTKFNLLQNYGNGILHRVK